MGATIQTFARQGPRPLEAPMPAPLVFGLKLATVGPCAGGQGEREAGG